MGKTADLTVVQKTAIDSLHNEGKIQMVIAKEAGCSQSSVSKHINREAKGRKRCGRKKCTSSRDNRTLERIVKQNPFKNVGKIHKELEQRQKCLAWAKDKKDWTAAEWSKVMFSDESKFCMSFGNQGPRVWRKRGEAHNPCCLRFSVKFPQSVMVWGAMSSAGVGPLCFLRSKVNAAVYTNSPDLNPIENLWGIVKRKMRYARPNNAEELKATIRATWALITPEQCHRLIDSMPRRIAAVIQAKGAPTTPNISLAAPLSLWNRQDSSASPLEFLVEPATYQPIKKKEIGYTTANQKIALLYLGKI
ncbi:Transposable element Tc1 transposase [Labeo rohita]|uniref:Transposable element Tc1 transposase n=1 Tax=Labeo rohita TaxID=84645 RepID=A0ABQ8L915_LABRO|nr:Transposable element Tc1 transposase [Labeo rohita]